MRRGTPHGRGGRSGGRDFHKGKFNVGRGQHSSASSTLPYSPPPSSEAGEQGTHASLLSLLRRLDSKPYPSYGALSTSSGWINDYEGYTLYVGPTQSDPHSKPTPCRVVVKAETAGFPPVSYSNRVRSVALGDYLNRVFWRCCREMGADSSSSGGKGEGWNGPRGGDIEISKPTQHVIEQSAVRIHTDGSVSAQFTVSLPARGRSILGHKAVQIFDQTLPQLIQKALVYEALDSNAVTRHVLNVEDQEWIRANLEVRGLVAFVPDGAILPRKSGGDDAPAEDSPDRKVVRFRSPDSLRVSFDLPNMGKAIAGIGIRRGVTLVVGGGFHGKSTVLQALQVGMYNKVPGDGREFCVCGHNAVKIRAEEGRSVSEVNIGPFVGELPFGKGTERFTTKDSSGTTSQAANIMEALEMGAKTLLIDEDTCASNFMIRDDKMMSLVHKDKEPITPFLYKAKTLSKQGISMILVVGSCGDFFDIGDTVIMMDSYSCHDVTARAKQIAAASPANGGALAKFKSSFGSVTPRCPVGEAFKPNHKVAVRSKSVVAYGDVELDLSGLEQLVSKEQTNAIALALQRLASLKSESKATIFQILTHLNEILDREGLDALTNGQYDGSLARPRVFEIAAAINRLRVDGSFVQLR